ncbi:MAG: hypothetical protein ACFFAO_20665 [Candidatus Hermodarchaeota archaeon]
MNDNEKETNVETGDQEAQEEEEPKKPVRKTQAQLLQEALGLEPEDIQGIEKKLFIARFLDYFSEETFDFIYKDRSIEMHKNEINKFLEAAKVSEIEEDKLIEQSFNSKKIMDIILKLKSKAEDIALNKGGIKEAVDKRLRKLRLIITLPIFGVLLILMFLIPIWYIFPLLCLFCIAPQLLQQQLLRKWYQFKEENKNDFYTNNRDDIMIIKGFNNELLENIRMRLLDMKVPLQIIKFILHSRDYSNLILENQKVVRGTNQFLFHFDYPEGMEPFPIPEALLQPQQPEVKKEPEKNFIILTELKTENGKITNFIPVLKTTLANSINKILNECEFSSDTRKFKEIISNYPSEMVIYCICGEIANFDTVQICNWKNQLKFYLFESEECKCGERIYVLSLIDSNDEVPNELKDIFFG